MKGIPLQSIQSSSSPLMGILIAPFCEDNGIAFVSTLVLRNQCVARGPDFAPPSKPIFQVVDLQQFKVERSWILGVARVR